MIRVKKELIFDILITFVLLSNWNTIFAEGARDMKISGGFKEQKKQYIIGEPISILFTLENQSDNRISFYIGLTKKDSFRFSAEANGKTVQQLDPYSPEGGLSPTMTVEPHDVYKESIFLNKYLLFASRGTYTVDCAIDLNILPIDIRKERETYKLPIRDKITVTLKEESVEEVESVLQQWAAKLNSDNKSEQREAAEAISSLRSPLAIKFLTQAMGIRDGIVQYYAARGLREIGTSVAIDGLISALKMEDKNAKQAAMSELSFLKAKEAVPTVIELLDDTSPNVRLKALYTLESINDKSCIKAVKKKLTDPDEKVRNQALRTLRTLENK